VPLSDHEQRLLEQMEQALQAEDPKFATTMRGADLQRRYRRRAVLAGLVFVIGVGMLMTGAVVQLIPLGVAGFVVMLASAWYSVTRWRRVPASEAAAAAAAADVPDIGPGSSRRKRRARGNKQGSFMERMEERWRRRRDQGYGR
jgi:hypothetical protein